MNCHATLLTQSDARQDVHTYVLLLSNTLTHTHTCSNPHIKHIADGYHHGLLAATAVLLFFLHAEVVACHECGRAEASTSHLTG